MITLEIVTPEKRVYESTVSSVVIPTGDGEIGVLPGHIPLISTLTAGELQINNDGKLDYLAVDKGYVKIFGDKVSVLTEAAIDVADIDLAHVAEARMRAEKAIEDAKNNHNEIDPAELDKLEAQIRFAIAQEITKGKRR